MKLEVPMILLLAAGASVAVPSIPPPAPRPEAVQTPATASLSESEEAREIEEALRLTVEVRRLIQRALQAQGFDPGGLDGAFGERTRAAIRSWQDTRGDEPTGYLDAQAAADLQRDGAQREELDAAEAALSEAQRAAAQAGEARRQAEQRAASAQDRAESAQEQVAADRAQYLLWIAVLAGVSLVLAALFGVFGRRSVTRASREQGRAEAQAQAAQADLAQRNERERLASAVPTVLLEGVDAQRQPIALRVPARAIAAEGGAVVGRNPHESTLVLDHAEVSRRHFRLSAQGASVLIEDLNSTNGTVLNEAPLVPNNTSALEDGALVQVGSLTLTVTLRA